jgi:hypothetical protein
VGPNLNGFVCLAYQGKDMVFRFIMEYLTLRLILSLNNPQNSEMKFCENMKLTC